MSDQIVSKLQEELQERSQQIFNADAQCSYLRGAIAALEGRLPGQQEAPELEVVEAEEEAGKLG